MNDHWTAWQAAMKHVEAQSQIELILQQQNLNAEELINSHIHLLNFLNESVLQEIRANGKYAQILDMLAELITLSIENYNPKIQSAQMIVPPYKNPIATDKNDFVSFLRWVKSDTENLQIITHTSIMKDAKPTHIEFTTAEGNKIFSVKVCLHFPDCSGQGYVPQARRGSIAFNLNMSESGVDVKQFFADGREYVDTYQRVYTAEYLDKTCEFWVSFMER